jgi:Putative metallopeptidase
MSHASNISRYAMNAKPMRPLICVPAIIAGLCFAATPALSQAVSNETDLFVGRINAAAHALGTQPKLAKLSEQDRQKLTEFVVGNMLFVILHELGHAAITQLSIPVLGKPEDAADSFAAVGLIRIGSTFTQRVLADAAKGWFLNDRRDVATDDTVAFYDEHGLDQQRAYQIVCFMVGSDDEKFKALAAEVKLPPERQDTCAGDYSNASWSWDQVLKPHVRTPDQPENDIRVIYGEAKGPLETAANTMKSIGLLEAIGTHTAEAFAWPAPFTLEAQTCGFPNARWDLQTHKLVVCYELAADFAELYRAYGMTEMKVRPLQAAVHKAAAAVSKRVNNVRAKRGGRS